MHDEAATQPSPVRKWVVYILESIPTGKLYTGMSSDVLKRLAAHNAGRGAKYTRTGRPWRIAYVQIMPSKGDALRREIQIKRMKRIEKLALVKTLGTGRIAPLRAEDQGE